MKIEKVGGAVVGVALVMGLTLCGQTKPQVKSNKQSLGEVKERECPAQEIGVPYGAGGEGCPQKILNSTSPGEVFASPAQFCSTCGTTGTITKGRVEIPPDRCWGRNRLELCPGARKPTVVEPKTVLYNDWVQAEVGSSSLLSMANVFVANPTVVTFAALDYYKSYVFTVDGEKIELTAGELRRAVQWAKGEKEKGELPVCISLDGVEDKSRKACLTYIGGHQ